MRKFHECDMKSFSRLFVKCNEEPIALLGDRLWPHAEKQKGDRTINQCIGSLLQMPNLSPNVEGVANSRKNFAHTQT